MKKTVYQILYEIVLGVVYIAGIFCVGFKFGDFCETLLEGSSKYVFYLVWIIAFWAVWALEKDTNKKD